MARLAAPRHLSASTRQWWSEVMRDYELESHHVRLLTLAAEALDRCLAARESLTKHGMIYNDRFGAPHARPEVAIERDARISFARLLRQLGLDYETGDELRPPPLPGTAGK